MAESLSIAGSPACAGVTRYLSDLALIPNRTIIGNRGSGKSVSLETMMMAVAKKPRFSSSTGRERSRIEWPGG